MVNQKLELSPTELKTRFQKVYRPLLLLTALCFTISLIFCLNEFPTGSDIPTHYIKTLNMRDMLLQGKFVRWSNDWYSGYAMFDIYPPLVYVVTALIGIATNNVAAAMKIVTIASFTALPIALYRLGRAIGRTPKGATTMALLFTLTPLNIFFLFNGYYILIPSIALMLVFLTEFFNYTQRHNTRSYAYSIILLAAISFTYHRTLYFVMLILAFYLALKIAKKQIRQALDVAVMAAVGVGLSAYWLFPAALDMLALNPSELYQSLILGASSNGVNFYVISLLFIVPYCYLTYKRIKKEKIRSEPDQLLLITLAFFVLLALGPYGPLYYVLPFSSSQRVEITLLMVTLFAAALASPLFDGKIKDGNRTLRATVVASIFFLSAIVGVFAYPRMALDFSAINFTYDRGDLNDSLQNLVTSAYVKQQVFLGKSDADFLGALRFAASDPGQGRIAFYSNRSQTVAILYYCGLLPLSGKSTPQGVVPEGEGDPKWNIYTQHIIWSPNETLLKLSGTRWILSDHPLTLSGNPAPRTFGQYLLYDLGNTSLISGSDGTVSSGVGETRITLSQAASSIVFAETYNPRWRAYDQNGKELKVEGNQYGFTKISSTATFTEVHLVYANTLADNLGEAISIACVVLFVAIVLVRRRLPMRVVGNNSI